MILNICSRVQIEFTLHIDSIGKRRKLINAICKFVLNELLNWIWELLVLALTSLGMKHWPNIFQREEEDVLASNLGKGSVACK